jgi:2',3'-cyclic-nucleotide 2'-phosphodiesterase (5'-nucleotidase family)
MFTKRLSSFITLSLVPLACAEDYLTSSRQVQSRYGRRSVDSSGNYNICTSRHLSNPWSLAQIVMLAIYHINDVHAHLDQFVTAGTDCTDPKKGCYGGYARVKTVIDQTRPTHENSLFLNAGDESQGTLFYTYYVCPGLHNRTFGAYVVLGIREDCGYFESARI